MRGLARGPFCGVLGERRIEGRGLGERQREGRAKAVQDVEAEQHRDAEPRPGGESLRCRRILRIVEVDERADEAVLHLLRPVEGPVGRQRELADLLL
jgi:hypothetical protein